MTVQEQVLSFIRNPQPERFDSLALDVFRHQYVSVPAYKKYCDLLGVSPDGVRLSQQIPMISTVAFKFAELYAANEIEFPGALMFLTSGTSVGRERRGRHVVTRPDIYRASAVAHLRAMMFPDVRAMPILAIHPTADRMPESSLAAMISWCIEEFGRGSCLCAADRSGLEVAEAMEFLCRAGRGDVPICLLGTTAAYSVLFDGLAARKESIALPPHSRMMDTGGAKGQLAPLSAQEVVELAGARLGLHPDFVINEYGMTELCSQLYDATALNSGSTAAREHLKIAPPWMRPLAIDPKNLMPVPDGTRGMLGFIDLANVCSVSAVLTEDFGIVEGSRVRVLGRAIAGGPRGCALSIAQFEVARV